MTIARMPLAKEIADFTFADTPINEGLVRDLASGGFPRKPTQRRARRRHGHRQDHLRLQSLAPASGAVPGRASSTPPTSSTAWRPRAARVAPASLRSPSRVSTSSCSTSLATCPSPRPEGSCSSISSRSSTRPRRSSSPPTWPSGNGLRLRRREDDDGIARPSHASLRHCRNRERQLALQEPRLSTCPDRRLLTPQPPRLRNPGQLRAGRPLPCSTRNGRSPIARRSRAPVPCRLTATNVH